MHRKNGPKPLKDSTWQDVLGQAVYADTSKMPPRRLAALLEISYEMLLKCISGDRHFRVEWVPMLAAETGDTRPLEWLCLQVGGRFVPEVQDVPLEKGSLLETIRETGAVISLVGAAYEDGKISRDEAAAITAEIEAAQRALSKLAARVNDDAAKTASGRRLRLLDDEAREKF